MARLVIGTSKAKTVPAIVRDVSPAYYVEKTVDANGKLNSDGVTSMVDLSGVKSFESYALCGAYYLCNTVTTVPDLSNVEEINGTSCLFHAFDGCKNMLGYVDLNKVTNISGGNVCEGVFTNCKKITGCGFKNLVSMSGIRGGLCNAFAGCNNFNTEVKFQSLEQLGGGTTQRLLINAFSYTQIPSIWFYALTTPGHNNNFENMLQGVTGCAAHFPMAVQSTMSSWTNVTNGFGGTNTTVLFDIVTSLVGADTNTYTRSEKDSTSTATAWTYNDTLYYTSGVSNHTAGVNEPTVGVTIYSDASCTTSVTTVASIA